MTIFKSVAILTTFIIFMILSLPGWSQSSGHYQSNTPAAAARVSRDLKSIAINKQPVRHWFYNYRNSQKLCLTDNEAFRHDLSPNEAEARCWLDPATGTWQTKKQSKSLRHL